MKCIKEEFATITPHFNVMMKTWEEDFAKTVFIRRSEQVALVLFDMNYNVVCVDNFYPVIEENVKDFPHGKVESHEQPKAAAIRIFKEKTGIDNLNSDLVYLANTTNMDPETTDCKYSTFIYAVENVEDYVNKYGDKNKVKICSLNDDLDELTKVSTNAICTYIVSNFITAIQFANQVGSPENAENS